MRSEKKRTIKSKNETLQNTKFDSQLQLVQQLDNLKEIRWSYGMYKSSQKKLNFLKES